MKKTIKILLMCFTIIVLLGNITLVNAVSEKAKGDNLGDQITGTITDGFGYWFLQDDDVTMDTDIKLGQSGAESSSKQITERLLGIIQAIGSLISVIALLIIGFRYMFSSLEEKASMKGVLIYYVIGAVLVFATSNLLSIVYKVITGLSI